MQERFKASDSLVFPELARFLVGCSGNVRTLQLGPNQSLEPTQHFAVSFRFMRTLILKVLGDSAPSR